MARLTLFAVLGSFNYILGSPLPQESGAASVATSTEASSASTTAPEGGATIVSAFVPSPGGPPNETLYLVTGSSETYLAGAGSVTVTASDGTPTTIAEKDVFVLGNDTLDYYVFDGNDTLVQAVECDISTDGMTATCNGTVLTFGDDGTIAGDSEQDGIQFSGMSTGVTAYLPTGTADTAGVSFASELPSLLPTALSGLSAAKASFSSIASEAESSASDMVSSAEAQGSAAASSAEAMGSSIAASVSDSDGADAGPTGTSDDGVLTLTIGGQTITA